MSVILRFIIVWSTLLGGAAYGTESGNLLEAFNAVNLENPSYAFDEWSGTGDVNSEEFKVYYAEYFQTYVDLAAKLSIRAIVVLLVSIQHGYKHTFGFGGKFDSSSLRIPLNWFGYDVVKVKLRYMYGSLLLCVLLMIAVMFELILRSVILLFNPKADLPEVPRFVQNVETD